MNEQRMKKETHNPYEQDRIALLKKHEYTIAGKDCEIGELKDGDLFVTWTHTPYRVQGKSLFDKNGIVANAVDKDWTVCFNSSAIVTPIKKST